MAKKPTNPLMKGIATGKRTVLMLLRVDDLQIDPSYQRGIIMSSVDRIAGPDFMTEALGIFHVGKRKGTGVYYVIDGQNRRAALKKRQEAGEYVPEYILCMVVLDTTQAEEAKMFVMLNTNKPVAGALRFRARLFYDSEPETTIAKWVKAEGFSLDFCSPGRPTFENTTNNGIRSVAALLTAYNRNRNHVKPALQLLRMAWGEGNAKAVPFDLRTGQVVAGIAMFLEGQADKSVEGIARCFRAWHLDLGTAWHDIRLNNGTGYMRIPALADWLTNQCGYKSKRKAA